MLQAKAAFFACRVFLIIASKRDSILIFRTSMVPIDVLCFSDDLPKVQVLPVILQNTSWLEPGSFLSAVAQRSIS